MRRYWLLLIPIFIYSCSNTPTEKQKQLDAEAKANALVTAYQKKTNLLSNLCALVRGSEVAFSEDDALQSALIAHHAPTLQVDGIEALKIKMKYLTEAHRTIDQRLEELTEKIKQYPQIQKMPSYNDLQVALAAVDKKIASANEAYQKAVN